MSINDAILPLIRGRNRHMLDQSRAFGQSNLFGDSSAIFSSCQKYRYRLDRLWDESLPPLSFGMLNPSTADHQQNDPTIERCERRARAMGFGRLIVWNLFAFRTSNPKVLKRQTDPIGPENDFFIERILVENKSNRGKVVVGWGIHGQYLQRHAEVLQMARNLNISLFCLGVTDGGQPRHPLYMAYAQELVPWL